MRRIGSTLGLMCTCILILGVGEVRGQSGGSIVVWGFNGNGECNVPPPNVDFVAFEAGYSHSLGLKSDGTIVAWGINRCGECNVPAPNADFVAVAAGREHSLALKSTGMIVAWGDNPCGECNVPPPNSNFVAVATGDFHSLGLKSDGTIVAWGDNGSRQCDVPVPNSDFVAFAAGRYHSLALKSDGTVVAWGNNDYRQCNVPTPNADFVAIAAGSRHSLGLKSDGTIVAWGWNEYGQCDVPAPNTDFVAVAAGVYHSLALRSDGTIASWGWSNYGQCDVPDPNAGFVAVAAGDYMGLGLKGPGYTPGGADIVVSPADPTTGSTPVTVAFDSVAVAGVTTLTISDKGPPPPSGFKLGNPPTYFEVATTAGFVGSIEICICYKGIDIGNQEKLKVSHWEEDTWVKYDPTSHDMADSVICARVPYLSPFAIFEEIHVAFDFKPGSCPNPFNMTGLRDSPGGQGKDPGKSANKGGIIPTALVGSESFDVTDIDITTILLMGVEPLNYAYEDVTRPVSGEGCACTPAGPDGFVDLTLKFRSKEIATALGDVENGDVVPLTITGSLADGTSFEASDCIIILSKSRDLPAVASEDAATRRGLELGPIVPNPFNDVTRIAYWLPSSQPVRLSIYDAAGRLIETMVDETQGPGEHIVEWVAADVPSGVYFCRLRLANEVKVKRIRLVK